MSFSLGMVTLCVRGIEKSKVYLLMAGPQETICPGKLILCKIRDDSCKNPREERSDEPPKNRHID